MARLPFSATRMEGKDIDVRRDRLPKFDHKVRAINDEMDDIVYNAIDTIQDRARDNELRTFYFNLMSDKTYDNRDFEDLIGLIADIIDIGVSEDRFRDVRDAIIPVCEDVIQLHVAWMTTEYAELADYVGRSQQREIDKAVDMYERYLEGVAVYRRNGGKVHRGRGRDDGRDRDRGGRDRGGRDRGCDSRGGNSRRDEWNRGAVQGGVHGRRQKSINSDDTRFGNTDQSGRFDDHHGVEDKSNDRDRGRDDRDDRRDTRNDNEDRFSDAAPRTTRRDEGTARGSAHVQRLPGSNRDNDIEDALAREQNEEGNTRMSRRQPADDLTALDAASNQDAWMPTVAYPHPLAFNHKQSLQYLMDVDNLAVIPQLADKEKPVDYYAHESIAFGSAPVDYLRFDQDHVPKRIDQLHNSLLNSEEKFAVEDERGSVTYYNRIDLTDGDMIGNSLKSILHRLSYRRMATELQQPKETIFHSVELAIASSTVVETFITTPAEASVLEELRAVPSFTKLAEKLRSMIKVIRPELYIQIDNHITTVVNHMLVQHLSIPDLRLTSFSDCWLEAFALITEKYGEGFRDAINTYQERELRKVFHHDPAGDEFARNEIQVSADIVGLFVLSMPTKVLFLNEVAFNLDLDLVAGVASQLLPETNPFFHDLAQELLTKDADRYGRFYIQTSDLRVIEASRSFIADKVVLLRLVK